MKQPFTYRLRVRYAECDAQKVVFNGRYVEFMDTAAVEFMRAVWGDYNALLARGIDSQVVHLSLDWKAPARFDDVIDVRVSPDKIGATSYALIMEMYRHATGRLLVSARVVYVMVSAERHEKMTIPEEMRAPLIRGAAGVTTDHAGHIAD